MSIVTILVTSVLGQIIPVSGELVKRDLSYSNDQHLTAMFGNNLVCGDHMCAPGEWSKLRENLNHAQVGHGTAKNSTKTVSVTPEKYNSTNSVSIPSGTHNSTSSVSTMPVPPIQAPPAAAYSICKTVKSTLTNSKISSDIIVKVMTDLGCI